MHVHTQIYAQLGAGQYNGQFTVYDMRKGSAATEATPVDLSHRDPIYDIAWLQETSSITVLTTKPLFQLQSLACKMEWESRASRTYSAGSSKR
eukprot:1134498-Pelagomonas_calceolata.AAC.1